MTKAATSTEGRDLIVTRVIDAAPESCSAHGPNQNCQDSGSRPSPGRRLKSRPDVRAGGSSLVVMRGPDGKDFPNRGVYLEVVRNERLVFADLEAHEKMGFHAGWAMCAEQLAALAERL